MPKKRWIKMDNASKIFMATNNSRDTKVFRLSADLYEDVKPDVLKEAVRIAYDNFPLYRYIIRRGFFWYYLEESDLVPEVKEDDEPPCAGIYGYEKKILLFKVRYYRKRISLDVFHALSDGTGAVWFLETILFHYFKLLYPEEFKGEVSPSDKGSIDELLYNSFDKHFQDEDLTAMPNLNINKAVGGNEKAYRVKGTQTPDKRMRVIEASMKVKDVLEISKSYGVSLTVLVTALFMIATYEDGPRYNGLLISASVPINLRQFFKSNSARNFFATMIVSYRFSKEGYDMDDLLQSIKSQFEENIDYESLLLRQKQLVGYERNLLVKLIPRPLKNIFLNLINMSSNKKISIATSNLGIIKFNDKIERYVENLFLETSAVRPQFVCLSFKENLTFGFTSPFIETEIPKNFIRFLTDRGVEVVVSANRVGKKEEEEKDEGMQKLPG
ncbi:MAG: hypothetical protein GX219_07755 [Tissierellia bacterium]|nr:hypothetical protein [Tissierellia bacterium]